MEEDEIIVDNDIVGLQKCIEGMEITCERMRKATLDFLWDKYILSPLRDEFVMKLNINKEFYSKLSYDKIKINWNKNPIDMRIFLSFLTIDVIKSNDHLGVENGWTLYVNDELNLLILGGIINGKEYLDSIQYKKNLSNSYNNFVNPFFLFDILSDNGKKFFIEYYSGDIKELLNSHKNKIQSIQIKLDAEINIYNLILNEIKLLLGVFNE